MKYTASRQKAPITVLCCAMRKPASRAIAPLLVAAQAGEELAEADICRLFAADGADLRAVLGAADRLRAAVAGDDVTYVVNRNINYTNICTYQCGFCAFSKGRSARSLRGPAYDLDLEEIARRTVEAAAAGATELFVEAAHLMSLAGEVVCKRRAEESRGSSD